MLQLIDHEDRLTVLDSELPGIVNGDSETTYTLRPISVEDHRRLRTQNTTSVPNPRTQAKESVVQLEALNDDLLDFVLQDWSGILLKGQPAPCTRELKLKLDGARRVALCDLAGMNRIARAPEVRAESFREPAGVSRVLDGRAAEPELLSLRQ